MTKIWVVYQGDKELGRFSNEAAAKTSVRVTWGRVEGGPPKDVRVVEEHVTPVLDDWTHF